jgi:hypothetical protein
MKRRTVAYSITTGLVALAFLAGGALDLFGGEKAAAALRPLGYPAYFALILGAWKILGALAIAVPGLPRLKEWAYAGMLFDLTGAALSHSFIGDPAGKVITPLVILAFVVASWTLRPASRTLAPRAVDRGLRDRGEDVGEALTA